MLTVRLIGLPAYVLLAERPPGRKPIAELLFADADDPLGALRWTLAELRRTLGLSDLLGGDPINANLGDQVQVDLHHVVNEQADPDALLAVDGELLAGLDIS